MSAIRSPTRGGRLHHLALDARRREQEIDRDRPSAISWSEQAYGRNSSRSGLLEERAKAVSSLDQRVNDAFGGAIVVSCDREIDVASEAGFSARGDGETADQRNLDTESRQVCDRGAKRVLERI